jgi:hypothetical protein
MKNKLKLICLGFVVSAQAAQSGPTKGHWFFPDGFNATQGQHKIVNEFGLDPETRKYFCQRCNQLVQTNPFFEIVTLVETFEQHLKSEHFSFLRES